MKLKDINQISDLQSKLERALHVLLGFEQYEGDTVSAHATGKCQPYGDYGRFGGITIGLPPVAKSVVVALARKEVVDLITELMRLGVDMSEEIASLALEN